MANIDSIKKREDFTLFWLDRKLDTDHGELRDLERLRDVTCALRTYTDPKLCQNDLEMMSDENIFLIVSGTIGQNFVSTIHDLSQIKFIYILCLHKREHIEWTSQFSKIRSDSIFTHIEPLIDRLKFDLFKCERVLGIDYKIEKSIVDVHYKKADFKWSRLLVHTLTQLPRDKRDREEMIDHLRAYYKESLVNLEFVDVFSKTYSSKDAILWYTRPGCLFRLLNQSFREENIEEIYRYRSFIKDLSEQIDLLHIEQKSTLAWESYKVYRGTCLSYNDIAVLKTNHNKLISFNGFLSTSLDMNIALIFIQPSNKLEQNEAVLFQFNIDTELDTTSYAYVGSHSVNPDELEMLFNIDAVFRIDSVDYDITSQQWFVRCKLCSKKDVDRLYWEETEKMNTGHHSLFHFGFLLIEAGQLKQAENFYRKLLEESKSDPPNKFNCFIGLGTLFFHTGDNARALEMLFQALDLDDESAIVYNNIANVYDNMGKSELALEFYARALSLTDDLDYKNLATTICNIGNVYHRQGSYDQAIDIYEKANILYENISMGQYKHPKQCGLYNNIALAYTRNGMYDIALKFYQDVLKISKENLPSQHLSLARCYNNIGTVLFHQNDYDLALDYYQMALAIYESTHYHHPDLAITYGCLAIIYATRRQYELAIDYHERAIRLCIESLPSNHPDLAARYVDFGDTLVKQKKLQAAEEVFDKALFIYKEENVNNLPTNRSRLATLYSSMANFQCAREDFEQAYEFSSKALSVRQSSLRSDHPDIITNLHQIGLIRYKQHQYNRALGFFKRVQVMLERSPSQNQNELAKIYGSLTNVYFDKAIYDQAYEYCTKCLHIQQQKFKEKHPVIAETKLKLGRVHARLQNYEAALDCYNIALQDIDEKADVYMNLGDLHLFQSQYVIAEEFYEKALAAYKTIHGCNHIFTAMAYSSMGNALYSSDKYDAAMQNYTSALEIYDKFYSNDHTNIAIVLNNIANIFLDTGKLTLALRVYLRVLEIYRIHFAETHSQLTTTRTNVARCYKELAGECVEKQNWKVALVFCQKAFDTYKIVLPEKSAETGVILETLRKDMEQLKELIATSTVKP